MKNLIIKCRHCKFNYSPEKKTGRPRSYCPDCEPEHTAWLKRKAHNKWLKHKREHPIIPKKRGTDWEFILISYNTIKDTNYTNLEALLSNLYADLSSRQMSAVLGICDVTIINKLRELGIPIKPRGGNNNPQGSHGKVYQDGRYFK